MAGQWFSLGTPDSSTNKTDHHSIIENFKHHNPNSKNCYMLMFHILYSPITILMNEYVLDFLYRDITLHDRYPCF